MTVPELVLAITDDLDDGRLQLADVVVLHPRPTVLSAALAAAVTLYRLPGCLLVAVGVETGGCLLCGHDLRCVHVNIPDVSVFEVAALAVDYYVSSVIPTIGPRTAEPGG
jgi:hypothetical protein